MDLTTNLTAGDFDCAVTATNINGRICWQYIGNDLAECIRFAKRVQSGGDHFFDPLTMEVTGAHHTILSKGMVLLLAAMDHYHRFNDVKTMSYPTGFPFLSEQAARGFTTNYNYLVHFGLLAKSPGEKNHDGCVHYWVTDHGREFIAGIPILAELYNIGPMVVGYASGSKKTFDEFFSTAELAEMEKPLWFLTEEKRLSILTSDELELV